MQGRGVVRYDAVLDSQTPKRRDGKWWEAEKKNVNRLCFGVL